MDIDKNLIIRKVKLKDSESIVSLTEELDYQIKNEEIKNKIERISLNLEQEVFIAEYKYVIGWMHISLVEPFESNPFVEIRGIVVNEQYRGLGIGTKLIKTAESWAKSKDCNLIRIRTNIKRIETRDYYKRQGFGSKKTQEVFEKTI